MKMKQLLRYTTILLRTVLLLGALTILNIPAQAQTAEQWAAMPNAFETKVPSDVIGDGKYYYIQFYYSTNISYLSDQGNGNKLWSKDYIPFAKNLQWTLVGTGVADQFKLKSLSGNWAYFNGTDYLSTNDESQASVFTYYNHSGGGYEIGPITYTGNTIAGNKKISNVEYPWVNIWNNSKGNDRSCLRVAKLKDNVAHIIYWQETIYNSNNNPVDPNADSRANANGFTTHHYLTYSGTGDVISDAVSSRKSVVWYYDAWNTLPTLAAYHQDGLWTLEKVGDNGEFYIKKYGTEEYLNYQNGISELGPKNADYGRYALEFPNANRYTRIQNANKFESHALTAAMFFTWNGVGANAAHVSEDQASIDFHANSEVGNGGTIVGRGDVKYNIYADLSGSAKLIFEGTPGMQLRVLLNRLEPIAEGEEGYDPNGGSLIERYCTIGGNGIGELNVSDLPFVHLNSIKNWSGSNGTVTAITFERTNYTESSLASSQFYTWNGVDAAATHASDTPAEGVEININTYRYPNQVIAGLGNASVYYTTYADLTGCTKMIIEGDPGMKLRVLLNRPEPVTGGDPNGGTAIERIVTINSYGKAEVDLSDLPYVHLNAIKVAGDSPNGSITSIKCLTPASGGNSLYLSCSKTDGVAVSQAYGGNNDYKYTTDWVAGFMPVEVPVPNKDEFYQVQVRLFSSTGDLLNYTGNAEAYTDEKEKSYLWQLEQVEDYKHFRLKRKSTGEYLAGQNKMTQPNDPDGTIPNPDNGEYYSAEVKDISKYFEDFWVKWYYVSPVKKEIVVNHMVTHKISYLQQYAQAGLGKQGLATDADSDWWNYDNSTQKTNHFEITHYVKRGNTITVEFPTVLNKNNDHIYYQRFYNYDEADEENMDLDNLKAHVSLDTRDDGDVQYFLYKNGMATGQKLDWTSIEDGGYARNVQRRFNFTNSDGNAFTVAADVSRYSDLRYWNTTAHLEGDLEEPSLTMRYIYYMKDAKVMAASLSSYTEQPGVADATTWKENFTGDADAKDAFLNDNNWMETKEFHFSDTPLPYENDKWAGYRGEFIGLRHVFSDYWVFDGNGTDDANLVSAVDNASGGKIEVRIYDPNNTGIRLGGWNPNINLKGTREGNDEDYQGFYFYDKVARNVKTQYGDSRFIVFRYPKDGEGKATTVNVEEGKEKKAYIHVYFNNNGTRYQLAQFTVIFDKNSDTRPWKSVNNSNQVKDSDRDPKRLREMAGKPIAKITFDYPTGETYHYPSSAADGSLTRHDGVDDRYGTIGNSSPIPLRFDNTNYAFDGDGCNWGSYAMVTTKNTQWGNGKTALPANDATHGYNIGPDANLQSAFLYIDASEQPGDICSADFQGEFCAGDKLLCSGWISGSNRYSDDGEYRCPGGITLTVKGENIDTGKKETIYRFCPGQCYELDNGTTNVDGSDGSQVVWQQFYFEFGTTKKYKRYWMEVNNNCVSSNGGDFMLDNVEVFALVPEVIPEMNTPVCINKDASEMQLLKLNIGFDKIISATNSTEVTGTGTGVKKDISFVFLEKDKFLTKFLEKLNESPLNYGLANVKELEKNIEKGEYENLINTNSDFKDAYKAAFNFAILGDETKVWDSDPASSNNVNVTAAVLNYHWSTKFTEMETYSFAKAVNGQGSVFRETDTKSGERFIVINGNYPNKLPWKTDTEYYVIPYNSKVESITVALYEDFNLCSACCKKTEFHLNPSIQIISMEASDVTEELVVCEGKIPTLLTNLKGYNINGDAVPLTNLNFDWWLGSETTLATLDNYHKQENTTKTARLDEALYILRLYYPEVTSLDGVVPRSQTNTTQTLYHQGRNDPELTQGMIDYLKSLVDAGQLILHQKSISVPAEKANGEADPYFYLVACPIHDGYFEKALNPAANKYVAYFCDEPQGLRIKVGEKAPTLKCGFVPYENGFSNYDYTSVNDAVLSIRLAKKEQFEEVQHGNVNDKPSDTYNTTADNDKHFLWLPIRNAEVESTAATGVVRKSGDSNESNNDYNVYLASTDDPVWDQNIYTAMTQTVASLPIVGKIVKLTAVNTKGSTGVDQTSNRLCIYFTENFDVREGYSYTLSLPYKENSGDNACDGTILINVKIVPDYEVWTGGAGNTDWNNDQNWRRADGNSNPRLNAADELYVGAAADGSPLKGYKSNDLNYRTDNDRVFRKGFAPLYCTHVLMKSDEWGNAPELYDALDGAGSFSASPFPNLRDTSTPILKFDMQARKYDIWSETYGSTPEKGRTGDLLAEMYQINTCDEIAFQPATELRNAHLLNYNNAWMEYQLDMGRWYLLGSALQGTIAGEWYAPTGTAQQKTTYYDAVTFGTGYDRYSPAIYQRSWDKAKAVLYEVGSTYDPADNPNDLALTDGKLPGSIQQGTWSGNSWNISGADSYLDRLGYKPLGNKKVNVAIKGIWSNTYNDATVDYTKGGFSVMVMNNLKGGSNANPAVIRLPKEDTWYDYYGFDRTGADNPNQYEDIGTNTQLSDVRTLNRAKNRGRLKTDLLLPESTHKLEKEASSYKYGDRRTYTRVPIKEEDLTTMITGISNHQETVSAGISNMGYYLVENPFPCGMNMDQFFETNTGLVKKYWLLTATGQHLVQKAVSGDWIEQDGNNFVTANAVVTPGQGFFVQATTAGDATTITFNKAMQAQSRYGVKADTGTDYEIVVGTKQKMTTKTETVTLDDGSTETVTIEVPEVDTDGNYVIEVITEDVTVFNYVQTSETDKQYALKARTRSGEKDSPLGLVITAQRGDMQSSALVMQRSSASNDFLPEEDTEVFINSDLEYVPMVYTLCGRLATTINSIHDFSCLPLGVESASDAPCTLTFHGVEMLGDSIAFYDAVEQKLTPLKSGMQFAVSGQTQNRYYLVRSLNPKEAAEETHLQIFTKGTVATVIASTQEPLTIVRCFDAAGRLVYSASPQTAEHSFDLPGNGVYIIEAQTENDRKTKKVMTK